MGDRDILKESIMNLRESWRSIIEEGKEEGGVGCGEGDSEGEEEGSSWCLWRDGKMGGKRSPSFEFYDAGVRRGGGSSIIEERKGKVVEWEEEEGMDDECDGFLRSATDMVLSFSLLSL